MQQKGMRREAADIAGEARQALMCVCTQELQLTDAKLSGLVSIMKRAHEKSTGAGFEV